MPFYNPGTIAMKYEKPGCKKKLRSEKKIIQEV